MKKYLLSIIILSSLFQPAFTQWDWAYKPTCTAGDRLNDIIIDENGEIYATGFHEGPITIGSSALGFLGGVDAWGAGIAFNGAPHGGVIIAGPNNEEGRAGVALGNGESVLVGKFNSPWITIGSDTLTSGGWYHDTWFVTKINNQGQYQWAFQTEYNHQQYDHPMDVVTDNQGNIFVIGQFLSDSVKAGSIVHYNANPGSGTRDILVIKLDPSGNYLDSWSWGGSGEDYPYRIVSDNSGNLYLGIKFTSPTLTFGNTVLNGAGDYDIAVVKMSSSGMVSWAYSFGGSNFEDLNGLALDSYGDLYISGRFSDTLNIGGFQAVSAGYMDAFFCKMTGSGNIDWLNTIHSQSEAQGMDAVIDTDGHPVFSLYYEGTANVHGVDLPTAAAATAFVKYTSSGAFWGVTSLTCSGSLRADNLSSDPVHGIVAGGIFNAPSLEVGSTFLSGSGGWDSFIAKMSNIPLYKADDLPESESLIFPNPADDLLNLDLSQWSATSSILSVIDLQGRVVISTEINGGQTQKIDISLLPAGLYLLEVIQGDLHYSEKILIE